MVEYTSAGVYVQNCTTLRAKITAIENIIDALTTQALIAAADGTVNQYSLDDGQTKINCTYRSPEEVSKSITAFEAIRQRYINQLHGRGTRLVPASNFFRRF